MVKQLPVANYGGIVLRIDYSEQAIWETVRAMILSPREPFFAAVEIINDTMYQDIDVETVIKIASNQHDYLFIADSFTISHPEHPLVCLDLNDEPGHRFSLVPSEVVPVDNNLWIANMSFREFSDATDADGIFRGFDDS